MRLEICLVNVDELWIVTPGFRTHDEKFKSGNNSEISQIKLLEMLKGIKKDIGLLSFQNINGRVI